MPYCRADLTFKDSCPNCHRYLDSVGDLVKHKCAPRTLRNESAMKVLEHLQNTGRERSRREAFSALMEFREQMIADAGEMTTPRRLVQVLVMAMWPNCEADILKRILNAYESKPAVSAPERLAPPPPSP
jgi:hypothetical protein